MDVEVVRWPTEERRLAQLRRQGGARLVLVPAGVAPPLTVDALEDWVRLPATDEDVDHRCRVLSDRLSGGGAPAATMPLLEADGILRMADGWVSLPPVEHRLVAAMVNRFGAVVTRDALSRAGWPEGMPGRNVLDVHILRLRRRLAPLDLAIRTVRSRGYLLEQSRPAPSAVGS